MSIIVMLYSLDYLSVKLPDSRLSLVLLLGSSVVLADTTILQHLHVLKNSERIQFKLYLLVFRCLHGIALMYLLQHIKPLADDPNRLRFKSSKALDVFVSF